MSRTVQKQYLVPFILITSLFFMWGFARAILDVLNKHFQESLSISITQSSLIQATTYLGYFLMALPAGIIITKWGYRRGVVSGLLLFGVGSLLFIPGEYLMSFGVFLLALFIIGCGLVLLETSANPYATELGDPTTAASRLNLAQSFNGLGCILAPVIVGGFLFSGNDTGIALPYTIMGIAVLLVAFIFTRVKLPEITSATSPDSSSGTDIKSAISRLWAMKKFRFGLIALLCYEISEISINSLFINYATSDGWMTKYTASIVLSFGALGLFMMARIAGSWIMSRITAEKVLLVCATMTVIGALMVTSDRGWFSRTGLFMCYAFEAIMFPTIFAITISSVKGYVKIASSFLMMTPIGGAIGTLLMSWVADSTDISTAFLIPAIGYMFVLAYAFNTLRNKIHK